MTSGTGEILELIGRLLLFRLRLRFNKLRNTPFPGCISLRDLSAQARYFLGVTLGLLLFGVKGLLWDESLLAFAFA